MLIPTNGLAPIQEQEEAAKKRISVVGRLEAFIAGRRITVISRMLILVWLVLFDQAVDGRGGEEEDRGWVTGADGLAVSAFQVENDVYDWCQKHQY
jgi:hypothetical protein